MPDTSRAVEQAVSELAPRAKSVRCWQHPELSTSADVVGEVFASPPSTHLVVAMAAAAQAAAQKCGLISEDEAARHPEHFERAKKIVDGAATDAAEPVLSSSPVAIDVLAGEGLRDRSPGAKLGQLFGPVSSTPRNHGVFDYVDGTGLAALGLENALALGALSTKLAAVPDLKAFAVLAPSSISKDVDLTGDPIESADEVIARVSGFLRKPPTELRVLTHSPDVGSGQTEWYSRLSASVGHLEVPEPVSVEPPYILSLARSQRPIVDCMIGVMGLVELIYAACLLDLLECDYVFRFRIVSRTRGKDLVGASAEAYHLTDLDVQQARDTHLPLEGSHSSSDYIPPGAATSAALFAVTPNPVLQLPGASRMAVSGLLVARRSLTGMTIEY